MSEPDEMTKQQRKLLVDQDSWLFWVGISFLVLAVFVLLALALVYLGEFHADFLTFDGALEAAGATLGSIATTFAAIGSALLFVVSLRVQARELQHSIHELRESVKAQKDAAENHKQTLKVAKEEKEFNVCLAACEEVKRHLAGISYEEATGSMALYSATWKWSIQFEDQSLRSAQSPSFHLQGPIYRIGMVLPLADNIKELRMKMYWVLDAVLDDSPFRKELDARDAQFIRAMIIPLIQEVSEAIDRPLFHLSERLGKLLGPESSRLEDLKLGRQGLEMCKAVVDRILEIPADRGYKATLIL